MSSTLPPPVAPKVKYINNKELLAAIHASKKSYCEYLEPQYADFDTIVHHVSEITPQLIESVREKKAKPRGKPAIPLDQIPPESIVVRVMTYEHIPLDPDRVRKSRVTDQSYTRTSFPPFKHYILTEDGPKEVLRSHWKGGFDNGHFVADRGKINHQLAEMFIKLVERYGRRGNWRGYCVDEATEALTQRGWLGHDEINETDVILSYDHRAKQLAWSKIGGIFSDHYHGKMFHLTGVGIDALVTPGHKFVTTEGTKRVEYLLEKDQLVLLSDGVEAPLEPQYSDSFVELMGWVVTEGSFYYRGKTPRLTINQNEGEFADRIRKCLYELSPGFGEYIKRRTIKGAVSSHIAFTVRKGLTLDIITALGGKTEGKRLTPEFILSLTKHQRILLINTMIDADGWRTESISRTGKLYTHLGYCQKDQGHLDAFVMLCTLAGLQTSTTRREIITKVNRLNTHINEVAIFSGKSRRLKTVENVDMHGGKRNGKIKGRGKVEHPNEPTVDYDGRVWCPETAFFNFVARRNGKIFLTGQTYNDEMQGQALLQLSQIGLQFDESKSDNPFAFYTTAIRNCLSGDTMILTREYGSVSIRDVEGQHVTLLDGNGEWLKCLIRNYGEQVTYKTKFQSGDGTTQEIWSTSDHGWVTPDGKRINTCEFNGKNTMIADLRPLKEITDRFSYNRGVKHGIVYGDGSKYGVNQFHVRLCDEKAALAYFFEDEVELDTPNIVSAGDKNIVIRKPWCDLKAFPANPGGDLDYLLGFLRGWFAANGCVSKVPTATLCGDLSEHAWLEQWGPLVGWHVYGYTKLTEKTNYGVRNKKSLNFHLRKGSMSPEDFLRLKHQTRWQVRPEHNRGKDKGRIYDWTKIEADLAEGQTTASIAEKLGVKATALRSSLSQRRKSQKSRQRCWFVYGSRQSDESRRETVYCPFVETTNSFALSSGIHTRQCFTRVLNLEKKNQNIRDDLLIIAGSSPSYTRQIENELEYRFPSEKAPPAPPGKRGPPKKGASSAPTIMDE